MSGTRSPAGIALEDGAVVEFIGARKCVGFDDRFLSWSFVQRLMAQHPVALLSRELEQIFFLPEIPLESSVRGNGLLVTKKHRVELAMWFIPHGKCYFRTFAVLRFLCQQLTKARDGFIASRLVLPLLLPILLILAGIPPYR